jgi:transcription-repair coupling factor (superfamily II helicase)
LFDLLAIEIRKKHPLRVLQHRLVELGYERVQRVTERGDYSIRGGLVDVFPITHHSPLRIELDQEERVGSIRSFNDQTGRFITFHQRVVILPARQANPQRIKEVAFGLEDSIPVHSLNALESGDCVVHLKYGIGRYQGRTRIALEGRPVEHLVVKYAKGEKLYVPIHHAEALRKYVGMGGRAPKLNRLNSSEWERTKKRTKRAIETLAFDLLKLQAIRKSRHGFSFPKDGDWQKELEGSFEYEETLDQGRASEEVKRDMERGIPMDRLICGDVGYGKTEVALRAVFKAVSGGKQVAILVPTTLLAEQHFRTFSKRFKPFPVKLEMLSRFRTQAQQKKTVQALKKGTCDVVIGTHRLFSKDIQFRNLGLVVIDEEQRFGVKHKERLKSLREIVDILTLTATPIPRTLYLSLMGIKDFSVVNTPPKNRIPIETHVEPYHEEVIRTAIERELARKGQVFFVHNRVEGIEHVANRIKALVPGAKLAVCHGQMDEKDLESIILDFMNGKIDILVCTNIIESGLDIPNANTLVVNRADHFGLAELYQLRGRVGRYKRQAYAYFLYPKSAIPSEKGRKRLAAIERFTDLGSGFDIAMEDLEIRGAGNVLGKEQHGWIMAVGFDLYCQLLKQEIDKHQTRQGKKRGAYGKEKSRSIIQ